MSDLVYVTVPPGVAPGQNLLVLAHDGSGRTMSVAVPIGMTPGSTFAVQFPFIAAQPPPPSFPVQKRLRVIVPPGVLPGAKLSVAVPDEPGRVIHAQVPPNNVAEFLVSYYPEEVKGPPPHGDACRKDIFDNHENENEIRCPNDHPTTCRITNGSMKFTCDVCEKPVGPQRKVYGCRTCNWDACEKCSTWTQSSSRNTDSVSTITSNPVDDDNSTDDDTQNPKVKATPPVGDAYKKDFLDYPQNVNEMRCPNDHLTTCRITDENMKFTCDVCQNPVGPQRKVYGCRTCNWDACEKCGTCTQSSSRNNDSASTITATLVDDGTTTDDDAQNPKEIRCPDNHLTTCRLADETMEFTCDICAETIILGHKVYDCRWCNWDACEECGTLMISSTHDRSTSTSANPTDSSCKIDDSFQTEICCPNLHPVTRRLTEEKYRFTCDICCKEVGNNGLVVYYCQPCDWGTCDECHASLQFNAQAAANNKARSQKEVRCPNGHRAGHRITKVKDQITCDVCTKRVGLGLSVYNCRLCNWDACEQCHTLMPTATQQQQASTGTSSATSNQEEIRCPNDHLTVPRITDEQFQFTCDMCKKPVALGQMVHNCSLCDWGTCRQCRVLLWFAQQSSTVKIAESFFKNEFQETAATPATVDSLPSYYDQGTSDNTTADSQEVDQNPLLNFLAAGALAGAVVSDLYISSSFARTPAPAPSASPIIPPGQKIMMVRVPPGTVAGTILKVEAPDAPGVFISVQVPPYVTEFPVAYSLSNAGPPAQVPTQTQERPAVLQTLADQEQIEALRKQMIQQMMQEEREKREEQRRKQRRNENIAQLGVAAVQMFSSLMSSDQ